jgi:hypothetical protein
MKRDASPALRNLFGSSRATSYTLAFAILLALPSLLGGLAADDYIHLAMYLGYLPKPSDASLFGLFSFLTGNPNENERLVDIGYLPWWSSPDLRVTFYRPLSELSHALDYRLWPQAPGLMHLHSVLWFALVVFLASRLYSRILGASHVRNVAAYVYAVSALHATTVGWIANRNALMASALGIACLILHDAWRRKQHWIFLPLSVAALAAALLSAEAAAATCAYLLAYALYIDSGSLRHRLLSLLPCALVLLAWKLRYDGLGFGAYASGLYLDPGSEPMEFMKGFVERAPVLLMAQLTGLPTSLYIFMEKPQQLVLWLSAIGLVAGFTGLFARELWRERESRFFLIGMLLSLLPVGAAGTDERSLIFVSLGGMGLTAILISRYMLSIVSALRQPSVVKRGSVYALAGLHVFLAPLLFLANVNGLATFTRPFTDQAQKLPMLGAVENQKLMLINSPAPQLNMHLAAIRLLNGLPLPHSSYSLAPGNTRLKLTRLQNSLEIGALDGFVINYDALFRGRAHPFKVGDVVRLKAMAAAIKQVTSDGRPEVVQFTFTDGIDDPSLRFLAWGDGGYKPLSLPNDGETVELGRQDPIRIVMASLSTN